MGGPTEKLKEDAEKQSRLQSFKDLKEMEEVKEKIRKGEVLKEFNEHPREFLSTIHRNADKLDDWLLSPGFRTYATKRSFLFKNARIPFTEARVHSVKLFDNPRSTFEIASEIASEKGLTQTDAIVDEMTAIHKKDIREKYEHRDYASAWLLSILNGESPVLTRPHTKIDKAIPELRTAYSIEGLHEGGLNFSLAARVGSVNSEAGLNISKLLLEKRSEIEGEQRYQLHNLDPRYAPLKELQGMCESLFSIDKDKLASRLDVINGLQDVSRIVSPKAFLEAAKVIENVEQLKPFWETFDALGRDFFKKTEEISVPVEVHIYDQYSALSEDPVLHERISPRTYRSILPGERKIEVERVRRELRNLKIVGVYYHHLGFGKVIPGNEPLTKEQSEAVSKVEKELFSSPSSHTLLKKVEDSTEKLNRLMLYMPAFIGKTAELFADTAIPLEKKLKAVNDSIEELRNEFISEKREEKRIRDLFLVMYVKEF